MNLLPDFANFQEMLSKIVAGKRPSDEAMSLLQKLNCEVLQWQHSNQARGNPTTLTEIDEIGGVNILLNCMTVLSNDGTLHYRRDERYSDCYKVIRDLCWNASDRSLEFCDQCGECGMLSFLANELRNLKEKFERDTTMYQGLVYVGFSILANCSKSDNNSQILDDLNIVSLATEYIQIIKSRKFGRSMNLAMSCSTLLAYTMNEEEQSGIMNDVIQYLVQNLKDALSDSDHRFSRYHADDIIFTIQKFSKDKENGRKIFEELNKLEIFSNIFKTEFSFKGEEKMNFLSLLGQLSFIAALKEKIIKDKTIMTFLRQTSQQMSNRECLAFTQCSNDKEKKMAKLILFVLESNARNLLNRSLSESSAAVSETSLKKISDRSLSESSAPTTSRGTENIKHIVLSFEKQSRALAVQIKSDLKSNSPDCEIYLEGDDDYSDESLNEKEIKTFQRSDASLLLLTKRYQNSLHCRAVAEFLTTSKTRKTISLVENPLLTSNDWIKSILDKSKTLNCVEVNETYYQKIKNQIQECLFGSVPQPIYQPSGDNESDDDKEKEKYFTSSKDVKEVSKTNQNPPASKHVMLSYQHDFKPLVLEIRESLEGSGYKTWMDEHDMKDRLLESMKFGVDNSAAFIMCISESYQNSENCRCEAEYAKATIGMTNIIPVIVQNGYKSQKWLSLLIIGILYLKMPSDKYDSKFHLKLMERLNERGKKQQVCK